MRYAGLGLAIGLLAVSNANVTAQRQTPGSQIVVLGCGAHRHAPAEYHPWIDPYGYWHYGAAYFPYWDGFLDVSYKNEAGNIATEVDWGLVARGSLVAVAKDVGRFSPGVTIDHEFVVSREVFPTGTEFPYCAVLRVRYADGTSWENPSPPEP
ncbi:MAG TPA: hypothetical protein VMF61_02185 [Candidatus Acidoferrales bacterium]|nr:hypothetical protein [Candidatus Acidoferrales bacterium]